MILAGDLGGTKTVVGLFEESAAGLTETAHATFTSADFTSMEAILSEFRSTVPDPAPDVACLGVAGPVIGGHCRTTNLPWTLDEADLAASTGIPRVKLLNDLEAMAYGTRFLAPDDLVRLDQRGIHRDGNVAVIAAGTGLGEAMLYWDGNRYHPVASEGGHVDFAPRNEREFELLRYLWQHIGNHVSYERVASGMGLPFIYRFLRNNQGETEPVALMERLSKEDPTAVISELALAGADAVCVKALDLFCSVYGAEAGNLALKCAGTGGVFIAGGIAPKILPALRKGAFMSAFVDKGRFEPFMRNMQVSVVLNPRTALLGAAHFALRLQPES